MPERTTVFEALNFGIEGATLVEKGWASRVCLFQRAVVQAVQHLEASKRAGKEHGNGEWTF